MRGNKLEVESERKSKVWSHRACESYDFYSEQNTIYDQSDYSYSAGINQSTLDNIVRGLTKDPRASTLHKVALAFNMTLAEFLKFDELNDYSFADNEDDWIS